MHVYRERETEREIGAPQPADVAKAAAEDAASAMQVSNLTSPGSSKVDGFVPETQHDNLRIARLCGQGRR